MTNTETICKNITLLIALFGTYYYILSHRSSYSNLFSFNGNL